MTATRHNIRVKTTGILIIFYCDASETPTTLGFITRIRSAHFSPEKTTMEPICDFISLVNHAKIAGCSA